jgi:hypothetical protein
MVASISSASTPRAFCAALVRLMCTPNSSRVMDLASTPLGWFLGCRMTGRREKWDAWKSESLALAHNAGVDVRDGWPLLLASAESSKYVPLADSNKTEQFNWRLCITCGGDSGRPMHFCCHIKRCTPNALDQPKLLLCALCAERGYYLSFNRLFPSEDVQYPFMVDANGVLHKTEFVWECKCLSTWNGCIDMLLLDCQLMVQIDGSQHFSGVMVDSKKIDDIRTIHDQQGKDWDCNVRAWEAGHAMLRLHYKDLGASGIALMLWVRDKLRSNELPRPLLVLSKSFKELHVVSKTHGATSYIDRLRARMHPAPVEQLSFEQALVLTV